MPGQLSNVTINGQTVSVIFPTAFTLPKDVTLNKISDHELEVDVTYTVKKWFFSVTRTGTIYYNFDTGSIKVTV